MNIMNRAAWLSLLVISLIIQPLFASAEHLHTMENVELTVTFPYHEKLYGNDLNWTMMEVEVDNQSAERIVGKLQLFSMQTFSSNEVLVAEQELDIQPVTIARFSFTIPISSLQEHALVRLIAETGEETFLELEDLRSQQGQTQLTIIGEQGNDFHFLKSMENDYLRYPAARVISPSELPESFWLYHESVIAVGHLEQGQFSEAQIKALEQWVKSGGVLILSGGEAFLPYVESFAKLLPVTQPQLVSDPVLTEMDKTRLLANIGLEESPQDYSAILIGQPKRKASYYPSEESPLFVGWPYGNGVVILAAYDVSVEPLASRQGNRELWDVVLNKFGALNSLQKKETFQTEVFRLPNFSEQIPNLTAPSIGMISVIWIFYLLIIGPVLYVLLKKWDKREWAWVIIPCLVVLTAVSVYTLGLKRIAHQSSSHLVTAIHIYDPEGARVDGSASFFVLEGNNFTVQVEDTVEAVAVSKRNQSQAIESYLVKQGDERVLHYERVPYMSLTHAKTMAYSEKLGYIDHDLWIEDNRLKGTLTNQTSFDLEAIEVQVGKQVYELGALAQQESKAVDLNLAKYYYTEYNYTDSYLIAKPFYETRMNRVNNMTPAYSSAIRPTLDLYALSHSPLSALNLEGHRADEHYTHFIRQELGLREEQGRQGIFPYGLLPVYMGEENLLRGNYFYHESILTSGSAVPVNLQVAPLGMRVQSIQIPLNEAVFSPFTIKLWNQSKRMWEELENNRLLELSEEEMGQYVNSKGELTLLFENNKQDNFQLPYPYVQVEGEWKS